MDRATEIQEGMTVYGAGDQQLGRIEHLGPTQLGPAFAQRLGGALPQVPCGFARFCAQPERRYDLFARTELLVQVQRNVLVTPAPSGRQHRRNTSSEQSKPGGEGPQLTLALPPQRARQQATRAQPEGRARQRASEPQSPAHSARSAPEGSLELERFGRFGHW